MDLSIVFILIGLFPLFIYIFGASYKASTDAFIYILILMFFSVFIFKNENFFIAYFIIRLIFDFYLLILNKKYHISWKKLRI